jgi:hypothetical protein
VASAERPKRSLRTRHLHANWVTCTEAHPTCIEVLLRCFVIRTRSDSLMASLSRFIVIIERSARQALLSAALLATALSASAQNNSTKIARDLQPVLTAATTPAINWARDINGRRFVKVLIVSNSDDAELALRCARR